VVGNLFKTKASGTTRVERMFLITPRMAGTRPANAQATLGTLRTSPTPVAPAAGVPIPAPAPATMPGLQTTAPALAAPARVAAQSAAPAAPPAAAAVAPAPTPAPAAVAPPTRASVVVDLDAMPANAAPRTVPPAAANGGSTATQTRVSTSQTN
jgi:hypothetical protein